MGVKGFDKEGFNTTSQEIARVINIENAKKIAFTLMIGFSLYHGCLMFRNGGNSCKWLLSQGRFQGYNAWQPYGCMVHQYSHQDARVCLNYISYWGGRNRLLFVGDARLRRLFAEVAAALHGGAVDRSLAEKAAGSRPCNLSVRDPAFRLELDFMWMPAVNGNLYEFLRGSLRQRDPPAFILVNSGGVPVRNTNMTREIVANYRVNLTYVANPLMKLRKRSRIIWMMQDPIDEELLYKNRSRERIARWSNNLIQEYNDVVDEVLGTSVEVWSSNRLIANHIGFADSLDGMQVPPLALKWDAQILLNMYCNNHMKFYDGTCCSKPERITLTQIFTFSFFGLCLVTSLCCFLIEQLCGKENGNGAKVDRRKPFLPTHSRIGSDLSIMEVSWFETVKELSNAFTRLGLILAYFFVCDRTIFFMKENKSFTFLSFLLPLTYIVVLGLFFTEPSQKTGVLHRDITDEWKGWMQLVILIYHLTGASKVIPIYMLIRCLVSAYLFLSGYGHFTYFWSKGDRGLSRITKVLFRLNLLVVSLCLVMNRPYQFYYFIPLVTFWFVVIYLTMVMWPQVSMESAETQRIHYLWFLVKLIIVVVLVTLLYASEFVFDKIFLTNPMKALFVTSDDSLHQWRFRWQLDRYSTLAGMLFGFSYQIAKQNRLIKDNHQMDLFARPLSVVLSILGVLGIIAYAVFTFLCPNKEACNSVHSYLVILPIVAYIVARNTCGAVRQKFSTLFAWFGRISLETFIAQYHIWLAADTHGVLVLIPSNQVLNIIVTSFIFVCVAHEIHQLTRLLLPYAVPDEWRAALRNFVLFVLLLLPIAISHGIFAF